MPPVTALLALPLALLVGALSDVVAGLAGRRRPWWGAIGSVIEDLRQVRVRVPDRRPDAATVGGAVAALLGAALAAGGALGVTSGSAVLVYLALAAAAGGLHLASFGPDDAAWRLQAAAAEPAFVAGLGVALLRWRSTDLLAVQGTQAVLGPGITLGPWTVVTGLVAAAIILLVAGALRTGAPPGEEQAGTSGVLVTAARWSTAGAVAVLAATLVVGAGLATGLPASRSALILAAGAAGAAVVLGLAQAGAGILPRGWPRYATGLGALVVAGGAAWLVVMR